MKEIVVLGAGYAGLKAVVDLQKRAGSGAHITLVDQNDYHYEATELHEVAAGSVSSSKITYPIVDVLKNGTTFVQGKVTKVDVENKTVAVADHEDLHYDYLVIALGFVSETFGIKGAMDNALQMTNIDTAEKIHRHVEDVMRAYAQNPDEDALKIVICGAGFTGVELAGAMADERKHFAELAGVAPEKIQIMCVEAAKKILPMFSPELANYGSELLQKRGIKVMTGCMIKAIEPGKVVYSTNPDSDETQSVSSKTIIWTTGVSGSPVIAESGFNQRRGRVMVDKTLTLKDHKDVYIVGDVSAVMNEANGRPFPTTAQIALQMGSHVAKSIVAQLKGDALPEFNFVSAGTVASVGNTHGFGIVGKHELKGYPASFIKKIIMNKSLAEIGGLKEVLAKGRFDLYH